MLAQSGWDWIKQNDHAQAKKAFQAVLDNDSTDWEALRGMILSYGNRRR